MNQTKEQYYENALQDNERIDARRAKSLMNERQGKLIVLR